MLDTGADVNLISRSFLAEHSLEQSFSGCLGLTSVGDVPIPTYGVCPLYFRARDALGYEHTFLLRFVVADIEPFTILLGMPWLELANPAFDFHDKTFAYPAALRHYGLFVEPELDWSFFGITLAAIIPHVDAPDDGTEHTAPEIPAAYADFQDLFDVTDRPPLPRHSALEHRIDLDKGAQPPWGPIYPLSAVELEILRKWLALALEKGWIQPSTSPAGAPILFVPKKEGEPRLVVDYRALNHITRKNRAPLPLIGEILDRLSSAKIFTKIDLKDAYYRIRIREGDEWKTAFRTRYGHFEFRVMPMGLVNAPATFQTYINHALAGLVDVTCIVYLDDILIFSDDEAAHEQHVREVLERLRKADLYINLKKCQFHTREVSFLGFVVSGEGLAMEPNRVEAIAQWPLPRSVHDIRVFLGFTGFYRRFIRSYAILCVPLTDLLREDQQRPFQLTEAAKEAFQELVRRFQEAPILRHFDPTLPIRVETDASKYAVGAVLSQLHGDRWHPVAYRSRKLTDQETRYVNAERELLALVDAFKAWRHYLLYSQNPVVALTDHLNLTGLQGKAKPSGRQLRWSDDLAEFDFVIKYRPGAQNAADGLSRRPDHMPAPHSSTEDAENELVMLIQDRLTIEDDPEQIHIPKPSVAAIVFRALPQPRQRPPALGLRAEEDRLALDEDRKLQGGPTAGSMPANEESVDQPPRGAIEESSVQRVPGSLRGDRKRSACEELPLRTRTVTACATFEEGGRCRCPPPPVPRVVSAPDHRTALAGAVSAKRKGERGSARVQELAKETPEGRMLAARAEDPGLAKKTLEERILAAQEKDPWVSSEAWKKRGRRWARASLTAPLTYNDKIYVPDNAREQLFHDYHCAPTAGHRGVRPTEQRIRAHWYWDQLRRDVRKWTRECNICARTKPRHHRPYGELAALPVPTQPWQDISVDFITGLPVSIDPRTNKPCDAILVIVDRFTKYALYIATTKQLKATAFADLFFDHVFRPFGLPLSVVSDRGSLFTSAFWEALCTLLAIKRRLSTAYHPQTDGQTERQNQIVEHYLRVFCSYDQADWAHHLILAEHAHNTTVHAATRHTPAFLLYGFEPRSPSDPLPQTERHVPAADARALEMIHRREEVRKILESANQSYEKWYNKTRTPQSFEINQWVWLSTKHLNQKRPSRKLADKYIGPFKITHVVGDRKMAYRLDLPQRYRIHNTFPISFLEPYNGSEQEAQNHRERVDLEPEERHYEVEAILDHRGPPNKRHYLIKWEGYGEESNSWEPREHLDEGPLLREYEARQRRAHLRRGVHAG